MAAGCEVAKDGELTDSFFVGRFVVSADRVYFVPVCPFNTTSILVRTKQIADTLKIFAVPVVSMFHNTKCDEQDDGSDA